MVNAGRKLGSPPDEPTVGKTHEKYELTPMNICELFDMQYKRDISGRRMTTIAFVFISIVVLTFLISSAWMPLDDKFRHNAWILYMCIIVAAGIMKICVDEFKYNNRPAIKHAYDMVHRWGPDGPTNPPLMEAPRSHVDKILATLSPSNRDRKLTPVFAAIDKEYARRDTNYHGEPYDGRFITITKGYKRGSL